MARATRKIAVDSDAALDAIARSQDAAAPAKIFSYRERDATTFPLPADAADEGVDVDREAFELAQQAGAPAEDVGAAALSGRILLVCSPGGHLVQMLSLEPAWEGLEAKWATLPSSDVDYLLDGQDVVLGRGPTNRSLKNLVHNFRIAWRTVRDYKPDVILSTGAALAVPFFIVGRLQGQRCVYVESFTRVNNLSVSGRLVYPLAHAFFVQWPGLRKRFRKATHVGSVV